MVPTRDQTGASRAVFETAVATVYAEDDGTVVLRFREGCRMTAENTPEVVSAHVAAAAGAKRPTLSDVRGIRAASREARELAAGVEAASVTRCMAILVENPVSRVLGNLFIRVRRPGYPTRMFSDEGSARLWLRSSASED